MSNTSHMVVATKFRIKVPISTKLGTWDVKGAKENLGSKIVTRAFVEDRNSHHNNELYVIDEEATKEMLKKRQANIDGTSGKDTKPSSDKGVSHTLTEGDIKDNPELKASGLKVGDSVMLDDDGNVIN